MGIFVKKGEHQVDVRELKKRAIDVGQVAWDIWVNELRGKMERNCAT